jgi:hypothetical protein
VIILKRGKRQQQQALSVCKFDDNLHGNNPFHLL